MSTEIATDSLVRTFIKIRDKRSELKNAFTVADEELGRKLKLVENELLDRANKQGTTGFPCDEGTAYRVESQHVSIADPDDFRGFVQESGDLDFYEQRPSLGHIKEYQKAHEGALPPGIRMFREFRMRVRKAKGKGEDDDEAHLFAGATRSSALA